MKARNQVLFFILFIVPLLSFSQKNIDILILNKNYKGAIAEINTELLQEPTAALYLKKGIIYQNLQDYQKALGAFNLGVQLNPKSVELLTQLAESSAALGNNFDAISFYEKAVVLDKSNLSLSSKLGRIYIKLKKYPKAYRIFTEIYAKDSLNVLWNKQLAFCAFHTFKRKQASYLYEKVIEMTPRDYGSYLNLIHTYSWKKEANKIRIVIEKGMKEFPNNAGLILEKAMLLYKSRKYLLAMDSFKAYLKMEKNPSSEIVMNYGISSYFSAQYKLALEVFNNLHSEVPNDPLVMYYRSLCYKKMKDFEKSEEQMLNAIEASTPDYVAEMYHHLGQIYGQQRKFKESVKALEKAYELNPKKGELLFEIATTYEEYNSNKTLALSYYQIYLKEVGEKGKNTNYALNRITKLKEDLFFE